MAAAAAAILLVGCQETMELSDRQGTDITVPAGEIPFTLRLTGVGEAGTRGEVFGQETSTLSGTAIQLLCFDASGYYLGIRQAYIDTPNTSSAHGTFSGYVPKGTARVHFVANVGLPDDLSFPVGTSEKVVMYSRALSTAFQDQSVKFWGYKRFDSAALMEGWLTAGLNTQEPSLVWLLRDRARIKLTFGNDVDLSSFSSIKWTVFNGLERGYVAPYNADESDPWSGCFDPNDPRVSLTEYEEGYRYTVSSSDSFQEYDPANDPESQYVYVFDDSNELTASGEDGRVRIILEVTKNDVTKYILILLKDRDGEQQPIIRNNTYNVNITGLEVRGYDTLQEALDPDADEFVNAPVNVDPSAPSVTDGQYTLELVNPDSKVVLRDPGTVHVVFKFQQINPETGQITDPYATPASQETAMQDFKIYWQDNDQSEWIIETPVHTGTYTWEFDLDITTIGDTYAFEDYLVIRHKASGLQRTVHVYAVDEFQYGVEPTLTQVLLTGGQPYMGPSGDDVRRPVFALRVQLPESLHDDMFPLVLRMATSTLEPFGDKVSSYQSRLSGGFGVLSERTDQSQSGETLPAGSDRTDWNYKSKKWNYWYTYTVNEYPENGEVIIYLKDTRDARVQASTQDVGLYLDVENFGWKGLHLDADEIVYPYFEYANEGGVYTVPFAEARYRGAIINCAPGTYSVSTTDNTWLSPAASSYTVTENGGTIDFIFDVTKNGNTPRSAVLVFTNQSTQVSTEVTINQEAGPDESISVRAENKVVKGDTEVVNLRVYSAGNWTISLTSPENANAQFSISGGGSTGDMGVEVNLIIPMNCTTEDVVYTITAKNTDNNKTATETVTQTRGRIVERTLTIHADDYHRIYTNTSDTNPAVNASYSNDNRMTFTFDHLYSYHQGYVDSYDNRFDISGHGGNNTATLTINIEKQVKRIKEIEFMYHFLRVGYYPANGYECSIGGTFSEFDLNGVAGRRVTQTWTAPADDPDHPQSQFEFTFTNNSRPVTFKQMVITYEKILWD